MSEVCLVCGDEVKGSRLFCQICADNRPEPIEPNKWGEIEI